MTPTVLRLSYVGVLHLLPLRTVEWAGLLILKEELVLYWGQYKQKETDVEAQSVSASDSLGFFPYNDIISPFSPEVKNADVVFLQYF